MDSGRLVFPVICALVLPLMAACAAPEQASDLFARMLAVGVLTLSDKEPA